MDVATPSAAQALAEHPFLMAEIRVEPTRLRLTRAHESVQVEPKVMAVLVRLAQQASLVVTREALLDAVWPDVVVNEEVLTRTISKLRRALQAIGGSALIETVPRKGYRLHATVRILDAPQPTVITQPLWRKRNRSWVVYAVGSGAVVLGIWLVGHILVQLPVASVSPLVPVPLTSDARPEMHPALSPDGQRLAFVAQDSLGGAWHLFVQALGGSAPEQRTYSADNVLHPAWSPNGQSIAFLQRTDSTCTIVQVALDSMAIQPLGICNRHVPLSLAWSPDGAELAYTDRATPPAQTAVFALNLDTGHRRQITFPPPTAIGDHGAVFSPSGKHLAFLRAFTPDSEDLYVIPLAGDAEPTRLTQDYGVTLGHTWHSDGDHVIVASNRDGPFQLWQVPLSGGRPAWLPINAGFTLRSPAMHSDGRLLFSSWNYTLDLVATDIGDGMLETRPLFASSFYDGSPAYSSDGQQVAFVSWRSGTMQVWVGSADGTSLRQVITLADRAWPGAPRWSPAGDALVFSLRDKGQTDVVQLDIASGAVTHWTRTPHDELAPDFTLNGQGIVYASNASKQWQIWKKDNVDEPAQQLTTTGGHYPVLVRGRNQLIFEQPGSGALQRFDLETRHSESLHNDVQPLQHNWALASDAVWFVVQAEGQFMLNRLRLGHSAVEQVGVLASAPMLGSLTVSPDGRRLLYAAIQKSEADVMQVQLVP